MRTTFFDVATFNIFVFVRLHWHTLYIKQAPIHNYIQLWD